MSSPSAEVEDGSGVLGAMRWSKNHSDACTWSAVVRHSFVTYAELDGRPVGALGGMNGSRWFADNLFR